MAAAVGHFLYVIPNEWEDGLFNLGGGSSLSIAEVANRIAKVYEKKYSKRILIEVAGEAKGGICNSVHFDINKLKKTGFQLTGNMEKEIEQTLLLCENFAN